MQPGSIAPSKTGGGRENASTREEAFEGGALLPQEQARSAIAHGFVI
jgi:hypothetical protein